MLSLNQNASDTPIAHIVRRLEHIGQRDASILRPQFVGESVLVASDHGQDIGGKIGYSHHTILVVDWNAGAEWWENQRALRNGDAWKGVGAFEFKRLNRDSVARRLPSFLDLADQLPGIVVSVLAPTTFRDWLGDRSLARTMENGGYGSYKPHIAEKLVRAIVIAFPWLAIHAKPGQKVFWVTDEDAVTKNIETLQRLWLNALHAFFDEQLIDPGIAVVGSSDSSSLFQDDGHLMGDLLSIPDLLGGAITEYLEAKDTNPTSPVVKTTTNDLLLWGARKTGVLKKCFLHVKPTDDGSSVQYSISDLSFKP